jgi:hypothetical protein
MKNAVVSLQVFVNLWWLIVFDDPAGISHAHTYPLTGKQKGHSRKAMPFQSPEAR